MESPRSPLAGRYRYLKLVDTGDPLPRWAAVDGDSGQHVLAAVVEAGEAARWEALKAATHLHLAAVLEVLAGATGESIPGGTPPTPSVVVVSELVPGQTLHGLLQKGQVHPFKAIAWVLRLIDAIGLVHAKGGVVGALSPRSIVVEPVGRAIAPVLATNVAPPLASYCSPERLAGAGPSADDDVWALHASLYAALTGVSPFSGDATNLLHHVKSQKPRPLSDFGVNEPILQRVLERGLLADERMRTTDLVALTEALDAWERGREPEAPRPRVPRIGRKVAPGRLIEPLVFDEASLPNVLAIDSPDEAGTSPADEPRVPQMPFGNLSDVGIDATAPVIPAAPPLPALGAPRRSPAGRGGGSRTGLYIGLGALAVLIVVGVVVAVVMGGRRPAPEPPVPVATASASAAASEAEPAALTPTQQRAACVASFFQVDVRQREKVLDFVCSDDDYRQISAHLFSLARSEHSGGEADAGAGLEDRGIVVTADNDAYNLGWYELAGAAIVRTTCCPKAKPIELPSTTGWCQQLQGQLRSLADASRKPVDLSPYGRKFEDAVQCLYSTGTKRPYDYDQLPSEHQQRNFQRFLKDAAESDAKRSRMKWLR